MTSAESIFGLSLPGGSSPSRERTELDIGDLFEAVASRWRLFFIALALTLTVAGLYVVMTPARYAATMSFLVDSRDRGTGGLNAPPSTQNAESPIVENQMRLLTSNNVLRRAVEDLRLQSDPEFGAVKPSGLFVTVKSLFTGPPAIIEPPIEKVTEMLARAISVKRADKSNVIDVETRASSPEKAERIARALAEALIAVQAQFSASVADKEGQWLDLKIDDLRRRLEQAEARVQDYRQAQLVVVTEGLTPTEQQIKNADAALVEARGKRAEEEAKLAQVQAATQAGSIETSKEAIRSPLLDKLLADYAALSREAANMQATLGPRHPAYIGNQSQLVAQRAQIKSEMRNVLDTQRRNVAAARNVERDAEAHVAELTKAITDSGGKRVELRELERQAALLRDNYEKALVARENTHAEVISSPNLMLINEPIAQSARVSPKTTPALIIAATAAVNLWIAAALVLEFLARRQATATAGAPFPEAVPAVREERERLRGQAEDQRTEDQRAEELPQVEQANEKPATNAARGEDKAAEAPFFQPLPSFAADAERETAAADDAGATLVRAVRAMNSPRDPYPEAVARLHERLPSVCATHGSLPIFAVTTRKERAGGSTLALALALVACDHGDRVLVIDCNGKSPTLAALLPYLKPARQNEGEPLKMFACRRDARSGGRILLSSFNAGDVLPERRSLENRFDLILLDCGARDPLPVALASILTGIIALDLDADAGRQARLTLRSAA